MSLPQNSPKTKFSGSKHNYQSVAKSVSQVSNNFGGSPKRGLKLGRSEFERLVAPSRDMTLSSDVADSLNDGIWVDSQRTVEYLSKEVSNSDFSKNYEKSMVGDPSQSRRSEIGELAFVEISQKQVSCSQKSEISVTNNIPIRSETYDSIQGSFIDPSLKRSPSKKSIQSPSIDGEPSLSKHKSLTHSMLSDPNANT